MVLDLSRCSLCDLSARSCALFHIYPPENVIKDYPYLERGEEDRLPQAADLRYRDATRPLRVISSHLQYRSAMSARGSQADLKHPTPYVLRLSRADIHNGTAQFRFVPKADP